MSGLPIRRDTPLPQVLAAMRGAGKSNRGAAAYSRWVNRPAGRLLAAVGFKAGLTPNQVSVISAVFTFAAIALVGFAAPTIATGLAVGVLLVLGYAFDSADGQLARLRGGGSFAGEWLDHIFDCAKASLIHLATAVCWFRFYDLGHPALLLIPLGFCVQAAVFFFAVTLSEQLRRAAGSTRPVMTNPDATRPPVLPSIIRLPSDYGLLCLVYLALGWHAGFAVAYTALFAVNVIITAAALVNWFREMAGLDRVRAASGQPEAVSGPSDSARR